MHVCDSVHVCTMRLCVCVYVCPYSVKFSNTMTIHSEFITIAYL